MSQCNKSTVQIGNLRHRVAVQNTTATRDAAGGQTDTYSTDTTVWAAVNPLRGQELINAQQVQMEITHKITMRHTTHVIDTTRILFDSRSFEVTEIIDPYERNQFLELMCKETK